MFETFKENRCLFVLICRILFSFIHPLEHNWKTYTSLIRKRHWNKFSAKMTSQDYTLRNIFSKKCLFCACGLYNRLYHWIRIIKFFLARHWDFIWWSSRSTYEQRPVSDVTNESPLAEPFPNPHSPTPLKVNSWECFPS